MKVTDLAAERNFRKLHRKEHQPSVNIFAFSCELGCPSMQKLVTHLFPFLQWAPTYSLKKDLLADIASGFTVGVMMICQGEIIFHLYLRVLSLS